MTPQSLPATNKTCHNCGIVGHFVKMCRNKKITNERVEYTEGDDEKNQKTDNNNISPKYEYLFSN